MSHIDTKCVQAGWTPKNGEARVLPIYQSTTFKYDSAKTLGDLFDLNESGHFYTRLSNPTLEAAENKIAALEGGVGAMLTSSGQAATMSAFLTICRAGDNIISTSEIYGGTYNLFNITLRQIGIDVTFINNDMSAEEIDALVKPNTKAIFGETLSNPSLRVADIEKLAAVAHKHNIPLIIDNTFPTPINCRPFEFGADIVIHSTSKYMDGHAVALGGVVVDSGKFDWKASGKFPMLCEPDESYHGTVFADKFGPAAFIAKARCHIMRDCGMQQSPQNAFLLNLGLETLALRMERHSQNGLSMAKYLSQHDKVAWVDYPGLEDNKDYQLACKYLGGKCSGVVSFGVKGGKEAAVKLMESLKLTALVIHVADARTGALHPASTPHRQLTDEQLEEAGVKPEMIRLSVGIENIEDIIADFEQALAKI